ncbi:MAG: hypothetical protein PWQ29_1381 [Verrucomicrobiota bacterium]|jgi:GxxExxY protein|nr:hypothetical protein [Verrucomicrobiota bacterium]MDK2963987.1 hypothetical protein [Verrucomicrobiota bacterium]
MKQEELTEKIIGRACRVYNPMGFGFLESVYEKCLLIEWVKSGLNAAVQRPVSVFYEREPVGEFFADRVVEDSVLKNP